MRNTWVFGKFRLFAPFLSTDTAAMLCDHCDKQVDDARSFIIQISRYSGFQVNICRPCFTQIMDSIDGDYTDRVVSIIKPVSFYETRGNDRVLFHFFGTEDDLSDDEEIFFDQLTVLKPE
jgi:hypothetical protein